MLHYNIIWSNVWRLQVYLKVYTLHLIQLFSSVTYILWQTLINAFVIRSGYNIHPTGLYTDLYNTYGMQRAGLVPRARPVWRIWRIYNPDLLLILVENFVFSIVIIS